MTTIPKEYAPDINTLEPLLDKEKERCRIESIEREAIRREGEIEKEERLRKELGYGEKGRTRITEKTEIQVARIFMEIDRMKKGEIIEIKITEKGEARRAIRMVKKVKEVEIERRGGKIYVTKG